MAEPLDQTTLDQLFDNARTNNRWQPKEVPDALLRRIVEHMRWAPTSANCSPARFVFLKSPEAKARLRQHLSAGNVDKTMAAPVTAIIAYDLNFYEALPKLFPHTDAKSWFTGKKQHADTTAFRNGTLQGGYFILAARALGLDCGPMSGFQNAGVDAEFFTGTEIKSNFLCNLGYGDPAGVHPRSPRFTFDEIAKVI
ncbi:malonic semialdehyde reductase [Hyphomicrobium facile]|uniref:Putative NADH dehydrogenase/NAD(P)H nitroreductase SAMN04488557_3464 n=1 Tax=Hyphomicrobium facile TaxID=51670 RepID=A0A1I7NTS1_9HYPH|nr:malonic semialdehyde reductase [Hyphomicrobium facile]SFV38033.1 3-hydroxypropanoate dehydrogenase [Hyphomicrobium facile]